MKEKITQELKRFRVFGKFTILQIMLISGIAGLCLTIAYQYFG